MFSHVVIGANDIAQAKRFYDAILGVIGAPEIGRASCRERVSPYV